VHVWVDKDPDAHAPPYPEIPYGDEDGVRPAVVEAKDGRHIAALEERADRWRSSSTCATRN
jgi:hypothetical protein